MSTAARAGCVGAAAAAAATPASQAAAAGCCCHCCCRCCCGGGLNLKAEEGGPTQMTAEPPATLRAGDGAKPSSCMRLQPLAASARAGRWTRSAGGACCHPGGSRSRASCAVRPTRARRSAAFAAAATSARPSGAGCSAGAATSARPSGAGCSAGAATSARPSGAGCSAGAAGGGTPTVTEARCSGAARRPLRREPCRSWIDSSDCGAVRKGSLQQSNAPTDCDECRCGG